MNSFAYITPSFAPDYDRAQLLCQTLDQLCTSQYKHYLVVDRRDVKLFSTLNSQHREILVVEDILPWWIFKMPHSKVWLSFKSSPLRNWIIQQIIKLSMAEVLTEETFIYCDSDMFFVKSFSLDNLIQDSKTKLFCEPQAIDPQKSPELAMWSKTACNLLKIEAPLDISNNYLGNFIVWRQQNLLELYRYLENLYQCPWQVTIARNWHLSEYQLYGNFVDQVLGEKAQHYHDSTKNCHEYWLNTPMNREELSDFFSSIPNNAFAAMISAKSNTPVEEIERLALLNLNETPSHKV